MGPDRRVVELVDSAVPDIGEIGELVRHFGSTPSVIALVHRTAAPCLTG